jgi:hypothetical protein
MSPPEALHDPRGIRGRISRGGSVGNFRPLRTEPPPLQRPSALPHCGRPGRHHRYERRGCRAEGGRYCDMKNSWGARDGIREAFVTGCLPGDTYWLLGLHGQTRVTLAHQTNETFRRAQLLQLGLLSRSPYKILLRLGRGEGPNDRGCRRGLVMKKTASSILIGHNDCEKLGFL